jgi:uncharacterized membrane protein YgdD (TMEM256/DUF423 family)
MNKRILITASILGLLAVVLGAFAAHGLENKLDMGSIESFKTGVRYQMYHAILLLFVANTSYLSTKSKNLICWLVLLGLILFSGSIYGLSTQGISGINFKSIGFITPIGGLLLLVSWLVMLINFVKIK